MNSAGRLHALQIGMMAAPALGGGLDRYYFNLMRALPRFGIDTYGLVVGSDGVMDSTETRNFARHGASMLERWRGLRAKLPALMAQSDLIVSHFAPYAFPILDSAAKRPFVNHFHGPWALEGRAEGKHPIKVVVRHHIERIVYARGGRIIVLSKAFADMLTSQYAVPHEKISVISGGVDLNVFNVASSRRDSRRRLGWSEHRPIIVTVRRLVHTKGLENLIAAAAIVVRDVPDVLLKIIGTGPLAESLRAMIEERGLARNVQLVGRVAEGLLPSVYRAANFVVVPSSALEGFGLIIAEALACGTPALVTPVGGLPEVVHDLDPALVFEGTTPQMLARGMSRALTGAVALPDSERCRTYAGRFDWGLVAAKVAAVYREVAAAPD